MLITPDQFKDKEEYLTALEDEAEKLKSYALTMVESLDYSCYQVPDFEKLEQFLKFAEGSIKKARRLIKNEIWSREVNRHRQIQKQKEKQP
jgi:hypothetical protein